MWNRAWILHSLLTLTRIVYPILGVATWQKAYNDVDRIKDLNMDFVEKSREILKNIILVGIVFGLLLDLFVWVSRKYATWILYYEIIFLIPLSMLPSMIAS